MEWTTNNIRQKFLDYFREKQHAIVDSAPIVIKDDPTLMFTNAGMNQFKGFFLGNVDATSNRIADSQKCLRVSGKHNDLEEVGRDHYHHTMFEMLGNWSFGDYFKKEAIDWAWELLVVEYGLDKDRVYVSVFDGDAELGVESDNEARKLWQNHMTDDRILGFGRKENFWEMGETGPCGPCSEVHFDMRSDQDRAAVDGATLVNADHPEVIEIWNLVFMQFNRLENGSLTNLKNKHIDTGMGLERLSRVLQKANSNYDIDIFQNLIARVEDLSKKKYTKGEGLEDVAFRVIADHIRAVSFCIADGQLPSNTGAGYVIRRVLRRAIRYGYSQLNLQEPFMWSVAGQLIQEMGGHYPELGKNKGLIVKVIREEEKSFLSTLDKGLERINTYITQNAGAQIQGEFAFELYDTYGFPIDLTRLIAEENGVSVDEAGFEEELKKQKDRSRAIGKAEFGDWNVLDDGPNSVFIGYDQLQNKTLVSKYRRVKIKGKDSFQIVLAETPFYAESGGQVGDKGVLNFDGTKVSVVDTKKENGEFIHYVSELPANLTGEVEASVNSAQRKSIVRNHSATHLLHHALRNQLGAHVEQKGSLVAPNRLRFDFSHFEKISDQQLNAIEAEVKEMISDDIKLQEWRKMPIAEAKEMGAMALFGEKYGNEVRVVKFGDSVELCGGTHVSHLGDIGGFKLVSEASVASGVRRVEAITGEAFEQFLSERLERLEAIENALGRPQDALAVVEKLQSEVRSLSKEVEAFREKEKRNAATQLLEEANADFGFRYINVQLDDFDGKALKDMVHQLTSSNSDLVVVAGTASGDKAFVAVGVSKELAVARSLDAAKVIKEISKDIDGGGGGQGFLATAGGKNKQGLKRALEHADEIIKVQAS